ncbi:glyoxylate/hydroxypyruvate reductase A [Gallaecimonas kandeliae]|uniref:2-hydroxyacid dehydrogenase n=1 Tax=Gallaecimonas kandeliae TaxID=3029055 RepID=UPI0026498EB9|nr:glyoxylate/hydroxypyruvate reductase A [Gallaecimonas kandeliae]WKE65301.1 glyoxylate/hydroxypyruvate reductase A [Gallaecimonas kandeliae]
MSLAIIMPGRNGEGLAERLKALDGGLDIQIWPDIERPEAVEFALCWQPPQGVLGDFPALKVVQSLGAGVDGLTEAIPLGVTLCRTVSPSLKTDMRDYVLLAILAEQRQWDAMAADQAQGHWQPRHYRRGGVVGIMGLGELGQAVAAGLAGLGFQLKGWSRTLKRLPAMETFHGPEQLEDFLADLDYLICLLPLTDQTRGLMDSGFFAKLGKPCYLIQAGRGPQLVEADLRSALDQGLLRGACLDVFDVEPLPPSSPLWQHPRVRITPHCASVTSGKELAKAVYHNYLAMCQGLALDQVVDPEQGY